MKYFCSTKFLKTKLFDFHKDYLKAGSWAIFTNYKLPIKYKEFGLIKEHVSVRENCGFFDVSHMGQFIVKGKDSNLFWEKVTTNNISNLEIGKNCLSLILNEEGFILDDIIVTKLEENSYFLVLNSGNKFKDMDHFNNIKDKYFKNNDIEFDYLEDKSLLAIQGPNSKNILQKYLNQDLNKITFMSNFTEEITIGDKKVKLFVNRSGYTGEDGFEISVDNENVLEFSKMLFEENDIIQSGLGARDSLRIEAGLCLYGNELNETIDPISAKLNWTIRKENKFCNYIGFDKICEIKNNKPKMKRFGFEMLGEKIPVARTGSKLYFNNEEVGYVTSGIFSPSLEKNIGVGYIKSKYLLKSFNGSIFTKIRNKDFEIKIKKLPFIDQKYFKL